MMLAENSVHIGYSNIPTGHIASIVTCLQMNVKPSRNLKELPIGYSLTQYSSDDLEEYRAFFRKIGADWLWFSRLIMSNEELESALKELNRDIYLIQHEGENIGMLELNFSEENEAELVFLGLIPEYTGKGIGRAVMDTATRLAWLKPIQKFWVHTCTFDHPSALAFYISSGFNPYELKLEVQADPRVKGYLPLSAAPHVPIINNDVT